MYSFVLLDGDGAAVTDFAGIFGSRSLVAGWSRHDLAAHAAERLGYAWVETIGSRATAKFNPDHCTDLTRSALMYVIGDCNGTVEIKVFTEGAPSLHSFETGMKALSFLVALFDKSDKPKSTRFYSRRMPVNKADARFSRLRLLAGSADISKQHGTFIKFLCEEFHGRYAMAKIDPFAGQVILTEVGSGWVTLDKQWQREAINRPLFSLRDKQYASMLNQSYREAYDTGLPIFELFDGTVNLPRRAPTFISYQRMILPLRTGRDERILMSATLMHVNPISIGG